MGPQKASARALTESENTGDFVVSGGVYGVDYCYGFNTVENTLTIYSGDLTISGKDDKEVHGRIVVEATASNAEPKITIRNLSLQSSGESALEVRAGANPTLMVSGENSLTGGNTNILYGDGLLKKNSGIYIFGVDGKRASLTIMGDGTLTVKANQQVYVSSGEHGIHVVDGILTLKQATIKVSGGDALGNETTGGRGIHAATAEVRIEEGCNLTVQGGNGSSEKKSNGGAGGDGMFFATHSSLIISGAQVNISGGNGGDGQADDESKNGGNGGYGIQYNAPETMSIENSYVTVTGGNGGNGREGDGLNVGPPGLPGTSNGNGGNGGSGGTGCYVPNITVTINDSIAVMRGGTGEKGEGDGQNGVNGAASNFGLSGSGNLLFGVRDWANSEINDSVDLGYDFTIQSGQTLTIKSGGALTIPEGVTLTNNGTIIIEKDGRLVNEGTIFIGSGGQVINKSYLENGKNIIIESDGKVTNQGTLENGKNGNVTVNNGGTLETTPEGTLHDYGTINGEVKGGKAAESTGALTITKAGAKVIQAYLGDTVTLTATIEKKEPEPQTRLRAFALATPNTVDFYWGDCLPENKLNTSDVTVTDGKATMDILLTEDLWTAGATSYPITAVYYGNKDLLDYDNLKADLLVLNNQPAEGEGYTVDYVKETAVAEDGYEISTDSNAAYVTTEIPVTPGGTVFVWISASERKNHRENPLPARPASPVNLTTEAASAADSSDGKICGCQPGEYQIRMEGESGFGAWTDALADANGEITGLRPGTYQLRFKASQSEPRFASAAEEVTVNVREPGGNTGEGEGGNTGGEGEGGNTGGEGEGGNTGGEEGGNTGGEGEGGSTGGEGEGGNTGGEGEGGNTGGEGEGGNTGGEEGGNTGGEEGGNTGGSEGGNTGEGGGHTGSEDSDEDRDDSEAASGKPLELQKETPLPETEGSWFHHDDGTWGMKTPSGGEIRKDWVVYHQNWYYLDENGKMAAGLTEIGGKHYYFLKDPAREGQMLVGWALENGTWYYGFEEKETLGEIRFGWVKIRGRWYYFGQDGGMLMNTRTPDGYYVGSDGAWIPGGVGRKKGKNHLTYSLKSSNMNSDCVAETCEACDRGRTCGVSPFSFKETLDNNGIMVHTTI